VEGWHVGHVEFDVGELVAGSGQQAFDAGDDVLHAGRWRPLARHGKAPGDAPARGGFVGLGQGHAEQAVPAPQPRAGADGGVEHCEVRAVHAVQ